MTKPPYKAGDLVTVRIDQGDAHNLNMPNRESWAFNVNQIIDHKPAEGFQPEPVVDYLYFDDVQNRLRICHKGFIGMMGVDALIKVTWTPGTKQATAEVIEEA